MLIFRIIFIVLWGENINRVSEFATYVQGMYILTKNHHTFNREAYHFITRNDLIETMAKRFGNNNVSH